LPAGNPLVGIWTVDENPPLLSDGPIPTWFPRPSSTTTWELGDKPTAAKAIGVREFGFGEIWMDIGFIVTITDVADWKLGFSQIICLFTLIPTISCPGGHLCAVNCIWLIWSCRFWIELVILDMAVHTRAGNPVLSSRVEQKSCNVFCFLFLFLLSSANAILELDTVPISRITIMSNENSFRFKLIEILFFLDLYNAIPNYYHKSRNIEKIRSPY